MASSDSDYDVQNIERRSNSPAESPVVSEGSPPGVSQERQEEQVRQGHDGASTSGAVTVALVTAASAPEGTSAVGVPDAIPCTSRAAPDNKTWVFSEA